MKPPRPRRRKGHGWGFGRGVFPRPIRQSLRRARQPRTLGICIGAPLLFAATANIQWPRARQ
eukprot:8234233-Alexandrium_andersonii.AAC.1